MDAKISEIRPLGIEPWVVPDTGAKDSEAVKPVPKTESTSFKTVGDGPNPQQGQNETGLTPDKTRQLVASVQSYLADLNTSISFEIEDRTGKLVTKVVNSETKEVIRQIPAKDLMKLHEKLVELRGVLFNGKA
jgi:flagellar protein FlaG